MKLRHGSLPQWAPVVSIEPSDVAGCAVQLKAHDRAATEVPQVTLRGPAHGLLLALWGRQGLEEIQIDGDRELVQALLASGITP
ncbi:MAG TPA: hypothetical protein DDY88_09035 [Actinobacteria bacterium]|nr:hypothetical protein [Actinomycetota bacterium]